MNYDSPISTEEELNAELSALLARAHDGGVDVKGGWECFDGIEQPNWDVIVTEVRRSE